ncbi:deazaflavin-dependent oxidoreductase, nitroreductase family [Micromonospora pallida]|uniref:Deazaflavin-dependent oxidoreductase, nitroreductase family n=1 Tax=Micromonospora pallida TaxID=145854 RepID=A0A1C6SW73_9ACTN|nr:nitroreductase/quinone reductase family protein [Micromonospora pallida]SCL33609.1 deazaflavin-dependent oxidoreductase, nitroreductase family [Micromonospora pallida]
MSVLGALARRLGHQRWFAAAGRLLAPADRLVGRLTRGRVVALGLIPSLVLTTTGRRSGKPRSNPLLYVPDGDAYVVVGSNWGQPRQPSWVLNLLAEPAAEALRNGHRTPVRAELATGAERERLWRLLVAEWPAYHTYARRAGDREIRVFRLVPTGVPSTGGTAPAA